MCKCCRHFHQVAAGKNNQVTKGNNCCSPCTPLTPPPSHNSSSPASQQCCSWPRSRLFSCGARGFQPSTCSSHSRCCSALLLPCELSSARSCSNTGTHFLLQCSDHHLSNNIRSHSNIICLTNCDKTSRDHQHQNNRVSKSSPHIPCDSGYGNCNSSSSNFHSCARDCHSSLCAGHQHFQNPHLNSQCPAHNTGGCAVRDTGCCSACAATSLVVGNQNSTSSCTPRISSKEDAEQTLISPESPILPQAPLDQRSEHKVSLFSII